MDSQVILVAATAFLFYKLPISPNSKRQLAYLLEIFLLPFLISYFLNQRNPTYYDLLGITRNINQIQAYKMGRNSQENQEL